MNVKIPAGVIAVVRADSVDVGILIGKGLALAGVDGIEITFTIPNAAVVIRELAQEIAVPLGAGTVRTAAECEAAAKAGATFIVSPDLNEKVVEHAHSLGLAAIPGALTPSEIGRCVDAGADGIKVFPVGAVGGAHYITTVSAPFPGQNWVVSGGIKPSEVATYKLAGCRSICLGSALIDTESVAAGDLDRVVRHAKRALALGKSA